MKSPGEYIREELKARGWTQADLATVLQRPLPTVNRILGGKHGLMPEMAIALGQAFGNDPQIWMERESSYRLAKAASEDDDAVRRRAKLFELAPINEIKKRGWIPDTDDVAEIEKSVLALLGTGSVDETPQVSAVMRMTGGGVSVELSPAQRVWCCRVRQLAKMIEAAKFSDDQVARCERALRKLAAFPIEARKTGRVLAEHGIRFVIVEHLSGTKIDGATMWLSDDAPVIGMSVRYDRIDNFWFTLFHELSHVRHRDSISVDSDITGHDELHMGVKPEFERRADAEASASIIDPEELRSFILRVGPLYSETKIIQFAHRVKIHPGLIVGQLHARNEFRSGYRACRDLLAKIREIVTAESLTDGWGKTIELKAG
jgi:HTH-type transcriptional regulator / antitoxin HigA